MKGTEKQINWALKIKKNIIDSINSHIELVIDDYEDLTGKKYDKEANGGFEVLDRNQANELLNIVNNMEIADRFIYIRNFKLIAMYKHLTGCIEKKIEI